MLIGSRNATRVDFDHVRKSIADGLVPIDVIQWAISKQITDDFLSRKESFEVAAKYTEIDLAAKALGSKLEAPFMTLSFMALLVIPHLKLSDKGLFNGDDFNFDIF